jgi:hypothetical protein
MEFAITSFSSAHLVMISSPQSYFPQVYFECNFTNCTSSTVTDSTGLVYAHNCASSECRCPIVPGTNGCRSQTTEETVALIKSRSSFRCRESPTNMTCVFDQVELGIVINANCVAGGCQARSVDAPTSPPTFDGAKTKTLWVAFLLFVTVVLWNQASP